MVTRADAEEVLRTLFADPAAARARAEAELVPDREPAIASIGHQVIGIVLRDVGETAESLAHLRAALRKARRSGDTEREGDVRATLGGSLVVMGRTRHGMSQLDQAAATLAGAALGRLLVRRAWVLGFHLARFEDAADDLARASAIFAVEGDRVWEARSLNLQGIVHAGLGDLVAARRAFASHGRISEELGNSRDAATSVHNRGWLAQLAGDLPAALTLYAEAEARFEEIGVVDVDLVVDRSGAHLAAGLATDALEAVERVIDTGRLRPRDRVELLVATAEAALAARDLARAMSAADEASRLLRRQGREARRVRVELVAVWARAEAGVPASRLLPRCERLVETARATRAPELPAALLLGARLARKVGSERASALVQEWLTEATAAGRFGTGTHRSLGFHAQAQLRELAGDASGVLRACDNGLQAIDEQLATFGSQELRALSTAHGAELAELGTRTALATGRPRRLLQWAERWRATALDTAPTSQQHDPQTVSDLAALRAQHKRLADARAAGEPTDRFQARAERLEQQVRRRLLHARGTGDTAGGIDVGALLDALAQDDTVLVELVEVQGHLHAVVAGHGRVRRVDVGEAAAASAAVDFALFALRGAARGRPSQLDAAGARLQRALVGSALDRSGEGRVVVSGTTALQGVPWGLLPGLAGRPVTSTPSARLWLRARAAHAADPDRRVLLVGPGLASGGAEVPAVAAQDPTAHVLDGPEATVEASLAALDGAGLAHVAAHGHFREDSPLFSSLDLADGPLLVHDLQRLRRPPHRVVLSACESGEMAPVGAQELLGLSAALLSMGTAGIVSSLGEVDDAATVEVMVALHAGLRAGAGLGEALLTARQAAAGDPVLMATAASFTVLGT